MKDLAKIILVSALGGLLSLGGYKLFFEAPRETVTYIERESSTFPQRASYSAALPEEGFVLAAEKTVHAVVHVKTAMRTNYRQPQSPLEFFFGMPQSPQGGRLQMGAGSGVIISEDGYIVTNNHVVENAEKVLVGLNNGEEYEAEVIGLDPTTDIALLKVNTEEALPYLSFSNSDELQVGEWVLAVGNPFNLTSTVTAGIVSAKARSIGIINERTAIEAFIQTDAAVNPGNSGGALVNTKGDLVGINSAISSRSGSFEGYSFAVPSNLAAKVVADLRDYGTIQRAFIGVQISDITSRLKDELSLDINQGVYVSGLTENGAAEEAGLESGDIIVAVNGRKVQKSSELQEIVGSKRPGEKLSVTVLRNGKERLYDLVLRNANGTTQRIKKEDIEFTTLLGGSFRKINDRERSAYGLAYGVKILEVQRGILAEQGIPKGFIITKINDRNIEEIDDLNAAVADWPKDKPVIIFGRLPNGREKYYAFGF